jgi:hypothetical protein
VGVIRVTVRLCVARLDLYMDFQHAELGLKIQIEFLP